MTIHHVQLWVPDLGSATESWGWLLDRLGYEQGRSWEHGFVWRHGTTAIVIEESPDMVPGMLHSRLRPGMNHIAFHVEHVAALGSLLDEATAHGWTSLDDGRAHPLPEGVTVAYLENTDGFEVELIAPAEPPTS